ncbi:MAG: Macrolide export ATP-binding/permease protein MacB [candidate division BRC1 bacterium ADurb.BinA364]|nr:MAG: Macrolide export ATP-binding/permease protein MacB [candidate division BRC1 bacterium ADurb.BinA364]
MNLSESVVIGFKEILAHKLRSMLTMLGVIFGVAAVIATVAIGAGAQQETLREVSLLGTNNIRVRKVALDGPDLVRASKKAPFGLTQMDMQAIRVLLQDYLVVQGGMRSIDQQISYEGETPTAVLLGVTAGYAEAIDFDVAKGRLINRFDMEGEKQVCVIGDDVRQMLFPLEDSLGKKLQIGARTFTVIGVMKRKSASSAGGVLDVGNLNQYVMIPLSTSMALFQADRRQEQLNELVIKIKENTDLQEIATVLDRLLERLHGGVRDFELVIPEELIRRKQAIQRIFGFTLIAIAGISLLVGGIGVMNIMLSTVTQRTREIGVRRAIGATKRDILAQFLIESLLLTIVGGFAGVGVGFGLAKLINYYTHWNTPISIPAIVVSFSVSAATGLIFGLYPALKAAQLDPIEALRYE